MRNYREHTVRLVACVVLAIGAGTFLGCGDDDDEQQFDCTTDEQCLDNEACIGEVCVDAPQEGDSCPDEHEGEEYQDLTCEDGTWVEAEVEGPNVVSVSADPPTIEPGGTVDLEVEVESDFDDELDYAWSAPDGWDLVDDDAAEVELVATSEPGVTATIEVEVTDPNGESAQGDVEVSTTEIDGPQINSVEATPERAIPYTIQEVVVDADHPEGQELEYHWELPEGWQEEGDLDGDAIEIYAPDEYGESGDVEVTVVDEVGQEISATTEVSTEELFCGGEGTESAPWDVCSAKFVNRVGVYEGVQSDYFELTEDVDMTDLDDEQFNVIGDDDEPFAGVFDGGGHVIEYLTVDEEGDEIGLFGRVDDGAEIRNLTLVDADVTGTEQVGGVAGRNEGSIVDVQISGDVSGDQEVGGLVGENRGLIQRSRSDADVDGDSQLGGLVGRNLGDIDEATAHGDVEGNDDIVGGLVGRNIGDITDSYATGDVEGDDEVAGLVGENSSTGTIYNTYATGSVLSSSNLGGLVASNAADSEDIAYSFWDVDTSGISESDGGEPKETGEFYYKRDFPESWTFYPDDDFVWVMREDAGGDRRPTLGWEMPCGDDEPACEMGVCDEEVEVCVTCNVNADDDFGGGDGSADMPWRVCTESHLEMMADEDYLDASFQQFGDIAMSSSWENYEAIGFVGDGYFEGEFDGSGYWIEGFAVDTGGSRAGLFGTIGIDGEVSNVVLVDADVAAGADQVGGLAGVNKGTITDSSVTGVVSGEIQVGALVGQNGGTIENSSADAQVDGVEEVGGLVGANDQVEVEVEEGASCSIDDDCADDLICDADQCVSEFGDDVLTFTGEILNSYATGEVDGDYRVGGLVGFNDGNIEEDSHASTTVSGGDETGGLVGRNERRVSDSYATGMVSGDDEVGGLVGRNTDRVLGCHATGDVDGDDEVGGLVGRSHYLIQDSYATGDVTGNNDVGGLVGHSENMTFDGMRSYATGDVEGQLRVGGVAGNNVAEMSVVYATGDVTGNDEVGGLVGRTEGWGAHAYASGEVTGDGDDVGGLAGTGDWVEHMYWDLETTGMDNGFGDDWGEEAIATGLETDEFAEEDNFHEDWDFNDVWTIDEAPDGEERPIFQWQD